MTAGDRNTGSNNPHRLAGNFSLRCLSIDDIKPCHSTFGRISNTVFERTTQV